MQTKQIQEHNEDKVSSIRVSHKFRARLAKIRARLTLKDGKDRTMEELLELLADTFEEKESNDK